MRVLLSTYDCPARGRVDRRATAVAGAIRTDGATVAATLLLDAVSQDKPPLSAGLMT